MVAVVDNETLDHLPLLVLKQTNSRTPEICSGKGRLCVIDAFPLNCALIVRSVGLLLRYAHASMIPQITRELNTQFARLARSCARRDECPGSLAVLLGGVRPALGDDPVDLSK